MVVLAVASPLRPCSASEACTKYGDYLHRLGHSATTGYAYGVAIAGGFAYVATGGPGGLDVIDIADPAAPFAAGHVDLADAEAVAVSGSVACVAMGTGLVVVDVRDPFDPEVVGEVGLPAPAHRVAMASPAWGAGGETFAFVAADSAGLCVVDVSSPSGPVRVGGVEFSHGAVSVAVQGRYAYVGAGWAGLQVVDIGNPRDLRIVGSLEDGVYCGQVAVQGEHAYAATGLSMDVIDVADPLAPRRMGSVFAISVQGIAVRGDYAYLAAESYGTTVVRIDDPERPVVVGNTGTYGGGRAFGVATSSSCACIANLGGLEVVDIDFPEDPIGIQFYDCIARGLAFSGNYICLVGPANYSRQNGIRVIDVSFPRNPMLMDFVQFPGETWDIQIANKYAYVVGKDVGFQVWNLWALPHPQFAGSVDLESVGYQIALQGSHAFVADYGRDLAVIDIASPGEPVVVTYLSLPGLAFGVTVDGSRAYVASSNRFNVVDIADPHSPRLLGSLPIAGAAHKAAVVGPYAFVAGGSAGLVVVDVSDPADLRVAASLDLGAYASTVKVVEGIAYVTAGALAVVDIRDPLAPRLISTIHIEPPVSVLVRNTDLYLADGQRGFRFLPSRCAHSAGEGAAWARTLPVSEVRVTPNPTDGVAVVRLDSPATGKVSCVVYDVAGRRVRSLCDGLAGVLPRELLWDGRADDGRVVASGVYTARVVMDRGVRTARIVVVR